MTDTLVARWHNRNGRQWVELYRDDRGSFWYSTHDRQRPLCGPDGDVYAIERCEAMIVAHEITGPTYGGPA